MDKKKLVASVAALALAAVLAVGCGTEPTAKKDKSPGTSTTAVTTSSCGTESGTGCAPEGERVDLAKPSFSDPTNVTNSLFPASNQESVLLLGQVDGKPF